MPAKLLYDLKVKGVAISLENGALKSSGHVDRLDKPDRKRMREAKADLEKFLALYPRYNTFPTFQEDLPFQFSRPTERGAITDALWHYICSQKPSVTHRVIERVSLYKQKFPTWSHFEQETSAMLDIEHWQKG